MPQGFRNVEGCGNTCGEAAITLATRSSILDMRQEGARFTNRGSILFRFERSSGGGQAWRLLTQGLLGHAPLSGSACLLLSSPMPSETPC
jgi:hypothetical protein